MARRGIPGGSFRGSMPGELSRTDGARPRVLAADDDAAFGELVAHLLDVTPGLECVGVVASGEDAVSRCEELHADLVLMDVSMPGLGGVGAARQIKESRSSTVVVLISTTHPDDLPREAEECSADAIVWKADLRPALLEEIWLRHRPHPC
jgi:two-component system invasion response regulator UvrY